MRNANLTRHAEVRLSERCQLSPEKLKHLLNNDVAIPVALQKGGRHAKRLLYSSSDQAWFIIVQDADDGGVLTVMPLDYLKHRIAVTAAQRRSARSRVRALENPRVARTNCQANGSPAIQAQVAAPLLHAKSAPANGWKIRVCYTARGATFHKNLPRTLPEHGSPAEWTVPGTMHVWFRESLMTAGIPFRAVEHVTAERAGVTAAADCLMEHLPMTAEEIEACK